MWNPWGIVSKGPEGEEKNESEDKIVTERSSTEQTIKTEGVAKSRGTQSSGRQVKNTYEYTPLTRGEPQKRVDQAFQGLKWKLIIFL